MKNLALSKSGMLTMFLTFLFFNVFSQTDKEAVREIKAHRSQQRKEFRHKDKSPLLPEDRKKFKSLNYYPIDLKYRVKAKFTKNEIPVLFKMRTTTDRLPDYSKYGEVSFELDGQQYKLEVYQSPDIMKMPGYRDYLFIPFTDLTNGAETYEVGRYLEFRIPKDEDVVLDFNLCYNPYCSYGGEYSCPIPPEANHLSVAIRAGEQKYHEDGH